MCVIVFGVVEYDCVCFECIFCVWFGKIGLVECVVDY